MRIRAIVLGVGGAEHYNNGRQPTTEGRTMTLNVTLLDLVNAVSEQARNDAEVIATVAYLVNSGRAQLRGTFKGARFDLRTLDARRTAA